MAFGDSGRVWSYAVREKRLSISLLGVVATVMLVASLLPKGNAAQAQGSAADLFPAGGAYFGSWVAPRIGESRQAAIERVESQIGRTFDIDHQYYKWDSPIPTSYESWTVSQGRIPFINWKPQLLNGTVIRWSSIASGQEDSWIASRADAFKAFGYPVYLCFHHEPEDDVPTFGQPSDFAAAFRRIVSIFRARGVTNVAFVWTMMAWTFDHRSGKDVSQFYPGDGYIDAVGSDGYDWFPLRSTQWDSFQEAYQPSYDWAVANGKPLLAVEYGVQEDPATPGRKGQWFKDALSTIKGWPDFKALIYFDEVKDGFPWITDSSSSSMAAYAQIGHDSYLNPSGGPAPPPSPSPSPSPSPRPSPSPSPSPSPRPSPSPSPSPRPSPSPSPSHSPSETPPPEPSEGPPGGSSGGGAPPPAPSPTASPTPTTTPPVEATLANSLDGGTAGTEVTSSDTGGASGRPFDLVVADGSASLVFDSTHARGVGLSARHTVGYHQNAYYEWNGSFGTQTNWFGRVYVWFDQMPSGDVRLVRAKGNRRLRMAIDLLHTGRLRVKDSANVTIASTNASITPGSWVRIEWGVDHTTGTVTVRLFNSPNLTTPTEVVSSSPGQAIGAATEQVEVGRSGSQPFSAEFWTDDPAVSTRGYLGPVA